MQLVAYGAQDIYLTGNPQITFFKIVYRRHTNFSIEAIEQTLQGSVQFGNRVTCVINRNADLIWKIYLQVDLPALAKAGGTVAWTRNVGNCLLDNIEMEIGGQRIDKHYGDWLNIWNELTQTAEHSDGYDVMIGNTTALTTQSASLAQTRLYIPLMFWFNRHPGLALPLIALQYHDVKLNFEFKSFASLHSTDDGAAVDSVPTTFTANLYVDYIYLDTDERRRFAQVSHEYLIEQLQYTGQVNTSSTSYSYDMKFNHPVKALVWVTQPAANVATGVGGNRHTDYTSGSPAYGGTDPLSTAQIQLNGHDRFRTRNAAYFNVVQPYQHWTRVPSTGIYTYSFALKPEEHQPSGTVNMSRIDNATLVLALASAVSTNIRVYALSYNVLRIMSGMGGLAYSN